MRDIDAEGIVLQILKDNIQESEASIYAGWPSWDVPSGLDITTQLLDLDPDDSVDATGQALKINGQVLVNVWSASEDDAREMAVRVHNILQHNQHIMAEGAEVFIRIDGFKPNHEIDPAGNVYRYMLNALVQTYEVI